MAKSVTIRHPRSGRTLDVSPLQARAYVAKDWEYLVDGPQTTAVPNLCDPDPAPTIAAEPAGDDEGGDETERYERTTPRWDS